MNVNDCQFLNITGYYLLYDAAVLVIGIIQCTAMFKMAQYSPASDRINLGAFIFCMLPARIQDSCQAKPEESKALFGIYFLSFLWTWIASILVVIVDIIAKLSDNDISDKVFEYFNSSTYHVP